MLGCETNEKMENSMHIDKSSLLLDGNSLSIADVFRVADCLETKVSITEQTANRIQASHQLLHKFVSDNRIIYGVNTSLGGFVNWLIPYECAHELQENLIASVATNVGPYLEDRIVRASMLARLNSLARGVSAISLNNYQKLLNIFNAGIIPCIPSKGSLGASGDLGPLACIALVANGKWKAKYKGMLCSGAEALEKAGIEPMQLSFKEGLSLINGTSAMTGYAALLVEHAIRLVKTYDIITSLSFEGLKVKKKPFNPIVHEQKPHPGQLTTSQNLWRLLADSKMAEDEAIVEKQLQSIFSGNPSATNSPIEDAYSIRCTPHIMGPIRDSLKWIQMVVTNELNSSNDNPLVLPDHQDVFHNGHFHGQYISMAMDHLVICLTTLSNLSDRRIDRFMDKHHSNQLPAFLCVEKPGLRFGLMGGQYMATSLTAENRSLSHPISIQSLTSTGDFQDIVSLGLVAARRAREVYDNTTYILAFELLCGAQAAEYRGHIHLSTATQIAFQAVRQVVPYLTSDQSLTDYLEELSQLIKNGTLLNKVEKAIGEIPL